MKKINIPHSSGQAKTIGRGRLIKRNKMLVSTLSVSMFLLVPTFVSSAESLDLSRAFSQKNPISTSLTASNIADFPQAYNDYSKNKGNTLATAKAAKVDRFVFANFGAWGALNEWNDDRKLLQIGGATAKWVSSSGTASKKALGAGSTNVNGGFGWTLDLMPNTNYTFTLENAGSNFRQFTNVFINITDMKTGEVLNKTAVKTDISKTEPKFKTSPSSGSIKVEVLGKMNYQTIGIGGDFYFTADKPKIVADTNNNYSTFYKLSELPTDTVQGIAQGMVKNSDSLAFYDSANNNSRITANFETGVKTKINEESVGKETKIFKTKGKVSKWGESIETNDFTVTVTNDIQLEKDLVSKADETKELIKNDPTLSQAEKAIQTANAEQELAKAKQQLTDAKTQSEIEEAAKNGKTIISEQYKSGNTLNDQKETAKTSLDKIIKETKASIEKDPNLTTTEKEQQIKAVDEAAEKAYKAIDEAKNKDEITEAIANGEKDISSKYVPGTPLNEQVEQALVDLSEVVKETKAAINNDPTLTNLEKEEQIKAVDEAAKKAEEAIGSAKTPDDLNKEIETGTKKIKESHQSGKSVEEQIQTALENLEKVMEETKSAINNDPTLSAKEKEEQVKAVETARKEGESSIKGATTADELTKAVADGTEDIKSKHKSGDSIEDQQKVAKSSLDKVIKETKEAITNDSTLTTSEKEKQIQDVVDAADKAYKDIDNAKNKDEITEAVANGEKDIPTKHVTGIPLADQLEKALVDLNEVVKETKEAISKDPTLTAAEKEEQTKAVDEAAEKAELAIKAATTADDLKKELATGTKEIKDSHQSGKSVEDQIKISLENLNKVKEETKEAITKDPTLTATAKEEQIKAVDEAAKKAELAIKAATTSDELSKELATGTKEIKDSHQSGKSVEEQIETSLANLNKVIEETKAAINNDPTLSSLEKESQVKAVDEAGKKGEAAIKTAKTANDLAKSVEEGTTDVKSKHQSGKSIEDQQKTAYEELDKVAKETKEKISKDKTLTTTEKVAQEKAVDEALKVAKEEVSEAKTADTLNESLSKGTVTIIGKYVPGNSLDNRKELAKESIDKEAKMTKEAISNDPTLTTKEKEKQSKLVDEEAELAKKAIDEAKDANEVDEAKAKGIESISNQHKSGDKVEARKEDAKKAIDDEAKLVKEKIANDPTLTDEEKEKQSGLVDQETEKAKKEIDKSVDANGVDNSKGKGITEIDNQYKPGSPLDIRKEDAKKAIDDEAKLVKEKIANEPTLTAEEKATQSKLVEEKAEEAKAKITDATNASGVDKEKGNGITAIDSQYQPGNPLDSRKEAAKEAIIQEEMKTKEQINKDNNLTSAEKEAQINQVDQAAREAEKAIDGATDASGVDNAKGSGITAIDSQYKPGNPLDSRKEDAKKVIDNEAKLVKEKIANDPTLTAEEKATQTKEVDQEASTAKEAIDGATDADGVDTSKGQGITAIDNKYQPGTSLDIRKDDAKVAIDKEAALIKEIISNDPTLTNEEKISQSNEVDQAATDAKVAIDGANDAGSIDEAKGNGIINIDSQYQTSQPLDERKAIAKEGIDQAAKETKEKIANDPTLTAEEKATQSTGVDQASTEAKVAIDKAANASDVDAAKGQGIVTIDGQYQPGISIDNRKEDAKKGIDQAAKEAKEKIANDPTLTAEEKATQSTGVDQAATEAKVVIDGATDAGGVDEAKGNGITNIDKNYQPGTPLDNRKSEAKKGIDEAAKQAKDRIANDPTLTSDEKEKQTSGVNEAAEQAKSEIDKSVDANGVDTSKGRGITEIDSKYQPGDALDTRKEDAKKAIDNEAKVIKEKITNDPTLTSDEKEKQILEVDEAAEQAKSEIDKSVDANGIDTSKGRGITEIDGKHQSGDALDTRKEDAKKAIDKEAKVIKEKIANDPTLTKAEKETQSKSVEQAAEQAKKEIDKSADANGVDTAKGNGITVIDSKYQPGDSLETRKNAAKKAIDEAAKNTIAKINEDDSLSEKEKELQVKGVKKAAEQAKSSIDKAVDANEVDKSKAEGIKAIDGQYQPNEVSVVPGKVSVNQLPNGDVIIKPTKPDGSTYPEGTEITIEGYGTFKLGKDGTVTLPNSVLKALEGQASVTVTEAGKASSQSLTVTMPAKKAANKEINKNASKGTTPMSTNSISKPSSGQTKSLPKTGSDMTGSIWATLMGMGLSLLALVGYRRKEEEK